MVFTSSLALPLTSMFILMLIGQGILLTIALLLAFVSFWETLLFPGVVRNNILYLALALRQSTVLWLILPLNFSLFADCWKIRLTHSSPTVTHCDNHSAIQIAHNDVFHESTKHIEIDCHHLVHHHVSAGILRLFPVSSSDQTTDIFTKTFLLGCFRDFVFKLKMASAKPP